MIEFHAEEAAKGISFMFCTLNLQVVVMILIVRTSLVTSTIDNQPIIKICMEYM